MNVPANFGMKGVDYENASDDARHTGAYVSELPNGTTLDAAR